jgi:antitoxin MazE
MRVTLSKWGNSLAFRVPKDVAHAAGFEEGSPLEMTVKDGAIVLSPARKRYNIDEMIEQMRQLKAQGVEPHPLIVDDAPVGAEIL